MALGLHKFYTLQLYSTKTPLYFQNYGFQYRNVWVYSSPLENELDVLYHQLI